MKTGYLLHILIWLGPPLVFQWAVGARILVRNLRAVLLPALLVSAYLTAADSMAIRNGIWSFDPAQILGLHIGWAPVEEALFFLMTALLVSQSFVLFLPDATRHSASPSQPKHDGSP